MSNQPSKWRVFKALVLNLPDEEVPGLKERLKGKPAAASQPEPQPQTDSSNTWDSVLANATKKPETESQPQPATATSGGSSLWQPKTPENNGKSSVIKTFFRWALIILLVLFVWIGIRTAFFGNHQESQSQSLPLSVEYPQEQAAAVATKFSSAYLTFEEGKEDQRAASLAPYYSGGEASGKLGWDGKGKQSASNIVVYSVEPVDNEKSRVTVLADVTTDAETKTVALEMSVSVTDRGAAVYGVPAYVGLPAAIDVQAAEPRDLDSALTHDTKASAQEFFTAYANNTALESVTAPGANITGLGGTATNAKLTKWSVGSGNDTERTAWATVTYQMNGATVTNSYQLKLVKVSGGEPAKWQIKEIKGSEY